MYSTYNEGKSVVAERIIKTLKNKIFKHMTSISKNVCIDVLNEIVNRYNNMVHKTIKRKHIDVVNDSYVEYNEDSNKKNLKFNPIWTGGWGADLAPTVRFFSVAPEVVMEGLWNVVTFPKIYLRRFSKKTFLVTMDCVAMATKLLEGSQDKKSIYFF